ncbi:MAG TPA: histidine kinase [Jiangellaceae bacterium]
MTLLVVLSPAATPPATLGAFQVARRRPFRVAAAVTVAGITAHAVLGWWRPVTGLPFGWWLVLLTLGYAALIGWGALAQARHALIISLRERARRAEEERDRRLAEVKYLERTRIAREMHDVLAHRLSLLATYAGALEYRPDAPAEKLAHAASVIRSGAHQALEELRDVIGVLRAEAADEFGQRPQPGLADVRRLVAESTDAGAEIHLSIELPEPANAPATSGRTAYRIAQEGLTNARKHAAGEPVHIELSGRPGEGIVIEIRNQFPHGAKGPAIPGSGTGLIGLAERVRLAGGRLDHGTSDAGEFRLHAWLPWPA